jgi:protein-L-isoaspartate(D-aspartate) O-methyltransferase
MVDNQVRTRGVTDRRLLAALLAIPRERFVPEARRPLAYLDEGVALDGGRRLGGAAPFARLVQLAAIEGDETVLDVGAASGYSTAVLARLAARVVGLESDAGLAATARATLAALGIDNAGIVEGDLATGGKAKGPFDVVVVEGVIFEEPTALLGLLKTDGRLVALLSQDGRPPVAHLYVKSGKGISARAEFDARLPPVPIPQRGDAFVF